MRLRIRWKLILGIGLPVAAVYGLILGLDYHALKKAALEQTEREAAAVADLYAASLDGKAERIAQVARDSAEFVRTHPTMTEAEIDTLLAGNVGQDEQIFGSCLAFEPGAHARGGGRFAPYVYRTSDGLARKDVAASYDYTDGRWEWYATPRETLTPVWTEPYYDEGGGDIVMCTFAAPVVRDGRLLAVLTVDVDVTRLQSVVSRAELKGGGFVIISRQGRYISHTDPSKVMHGKVQDEVAALGLPELTELVQRMLSGQRGAATLPSPWRPGRTELIFFSPIPSTGWSFVAMNDLGLAMQRVMSRLTERGGALSGGMVAILAVIFVMGTLITRPIKPLMAGVRDLAAGKLDARIEGVRRRDELGELADTFNAMTAQLREHVEALGKARAAREAADSELRVAKDIQSSLLPKTFPGAAESGFDLYAVCRPARAVGGDFYDFLFVRPDQMLFLVADVSGKGVPAALYMAVARTLIRDLARAGYGPAQILSHANEILASEGENGMFLTTFVGLYKPSTGELRYAGAGHPPPLKLSNGTGAREICEGLDVVLGVVPGAEYGERVEVLRVGERLVLFTDGVTEARSPDGGFFGNDRTASLAGETAHLGAEVACSECLKVLEEFEAGDQADDITIMILERRG